MNNDTRTTPDPAIESPTLQDHNASFRPPIARFLVPNALSKKGPPAVRLGNVLYQIL